MKHRDESEFEQSCTSWFTHSPKGWEACSFRHCLEDVFNGLSVTQVDEAIDCVPVTRIETISSGLIDESRLGYIPRSEAREDRRLVNGDILFSNINSLNMIGNCAIYTGGREIFAGMNLLVLRPNTQSHSKWLYWLIKSSVLREVFESLAKPAINQASISQASIKSVKIPKPPLPEQRSIAAFLDAETSKIDALVAEQRRLIELLKEKRHAVISHAVTKGLNPHVKMKPSGIDWLGDVPEHWELSRGRYLYRERNEIPEPDDGVVTSFRDGQVTLRTNRRTEGFTFAILELGYQRVREGDLVIHGMDAFAGAIGVSESTGKCTPEYSVLIPNSAATDNRYYSYLVRLMALRNYVYVICPSVRERAPRFRFSSFKNVLLPSPPHEEQLAIVNEIEMVTTQTSNLISESELAIALLQERRAALISAAVTGKIDVRGFVSKEASA